jgi:hypothetical protein
MLRSYDHHQTAYSSILNDRSGSYFTTDSQSVCLGIEHPCGTCDQALLPVGMLLSEICGLVSIGRPLWRENGSAICSVITRSYFTTESQSVSMSWYRAPLWDLWPGITSCRNFAVWKFRFCFCGAPSLTRGRVCNLRCNHSMVRVAQNPKPYFTVSSETPPTWRAMFPYLYPTGTGWPSYTPGHWVTEWPITALLIIHTQQEAHNSSHNSWLPR